MNTTKKVYNKKFEFDVDKLTVIEIFYFIAEYELINYEDYFKNIKKLIKIKNRDLLYILDFLCKNNFVEINGNNQIVVLKKMNSIEIQQIFESFKKCIIYTLNEIEVLRNELFNIAKFVVQHDDILIELNSVPLSYRQYFQILENMDIITSHFDLAYKKVVDIGLGEILLSRPLKKISIEEFEKIQNAKKIKGEKAENFVFEFECKKLANTKKLPEIVSRENIALGYDIKSYSIEGDEIYIEVKALTDSYSFFWSCNEINVSKLLRKKYYLYCVEFKNNFPQIIAKIYNDPYKLIIIDKILDFNQVGDLEVSIVK